MKLDVIMSGTHVDVELLKAVIDVAKQSCGRADWSDIEPSLAAAWEDLRGQDTPSWDVVADEVRAGCRQANLLA